MRRGAGGEEWEGEKKKKKKKTPSIHQDAIQALLDC